MKGDRDAETCGLDGLVFIRASGEMGFLGRLSSIVIGAIKGDDSSRKVLVMDWLIWIQE